MKTITFYSYKGGVGRTLALANTAKRLSEFKKEFVFLTLILKTRVAFKVSTIITRKREQARHCRLYV